MNYSLREKKIRGLDTLLSSFERQEIMAKSSYDLHGNSCHLVIGFSSICGGCWASLRILLLSSEGSREF